MTEAEKRLIKAREKLKFFLTSNGDNVTKMNEKENEDAIHKKDSTSIQCRAKIMR